MATIKKREGKNSTSYLIRSSCGYDTSGKQIMRSMTWKPTQGMTAKQIEKELNRQAVLFDEQCASQGVGNGNVKFETFARQWFKEYAEVNLRPRTVARLHQLEERTYAAIGHIRLDKLTARHIQRFIDDLGKDGVSKSRDFAKANVDLPGLLEEKGMTQKALSMSAQVSASTVSAACHGGYVSIPVAGKISDALGMKDIFTVKKGKGRLAPKSIQHYLSFVSSVLDYAFRFELIQVNPCKRVVVPQAERNEKEVYTLDEAQRFLESLEKAPIRYRAFFVLAMYSGLRRGELLGLEWQDIDFEAHTLSVRRSSLYTREKGTFTDTTKTKGSQRTIKLPDSVFVVLRYHRAEQTQQRMLMGDRWNNTNRLFTTLEGDPMHPNTPYQWLRKFCEETGQRFLGVHSFRHLNASLLINSGMDIKAVSKSLGHSQVTTTLNIYAHTFEEAQARASEAVADLLENRKRTG